MPILDFGGKLYTSLFLQKVPILPKNLEEALD
jgi:hypothetical protein